MSGTVRIEKCANQPAATTRKTALEGLGYSVVIAQNSANVVTATASPDGSSTTDDSLVTVNAAFVVLGVRAT
ncbi:MAG TPA: hypothetical protein VET85_08125 [Stellaceae bacterium]|nr:hypothetical protein [Stellaceae bacterium]